MRYYTYDSLTPDNGATPLRTLFQVVAPANQRVKIYGADFSLGGADASTQPVLFDWLLQTSAGTSAGLTPQYQDRQTVPKQTYQATLLKTFTGAEPTGPTTLIYFTCHQQGTYLWRPLFPIWVGGGERVGLRYNSSTFVAVTFTVYIEE